MCWLVGGLDDFGLSLPSSNWQDLIGQIKKFSTMSAFSLGLNTYSVPYAMFTENRDRLMKSLIEKGIRYVYIYYYFVVKKKVSS